MAQRNYTVYLEGGAAFNIKAARFEVTQAGVFFYNEEGTPLGDTYIDPKSVMAVIPPSPLSGGSAAGFTRT
ncbi:MAG: hypothetical protein ACE5G0_02910 [Rhodothermales bacterium]